MSREDEVWEQLAWRLWQVQQHMSAVETLYAELGQGPRVKWAHTFNDSIGTALNVATAAPAPA